MPSLRRRSITPEDLYRFRLLSGSQISPDGTIAAYALHRVDRETEKKRANLWIVPCGRGGPRQFTFGDHVDVAPRFSSDGTRLAFLSNRRDEKQPQVYVIRVDGGEARQLTRLKGSIDAFSWSPDGRRLVVQFRARDAEDIARERDPRRRKLGVVERHVSRVFFKEDGLGYLPKERHHLWIVDVRTGRARQLTEGEIHDEWAPCWSPDGKRIVFCSNRSPDPDFDPDAIDLFTVPAEGGKTRRIPTPSGPKDSPSFSPDGRTIAYLGREGKNEGWRLTRLWVVPASGRGEARCLTAGEDFNVSAWTINDLGTAQQMPPTWLPDGRAILVQVAHHGRTTLKAIDATEGAAPPRDVIDEKGVVASFSVDAAGERLLVHFGTMTDPGELWIHHLAGGRARQLTRVNGAMLRRLDLGSFEEIWFKGPDDNDLQGWILKPPGFDRRRKYPSILEIHGGPRVQYGHFFMHEFLALAARGYVVAFCNPRGGQGYGEAHSRAIRNQWGTVDYEDLMAWADLVSRKAYIDVRRMGVTGGSYGGYMTNWIIGHTERFRAAVTQRSVSNLISMYGSSDFNWAFEEEFGGAPPWEAHEAYWRQSPIKYIGNARTPTLVIHSEQDLRCAIEQSEQVYVALKRLGVETEMVRFPDEPHGLSRTGRTDRRIARLNHIIRWFDRHLK